MEKLNSLYYQLIFIIKTIPVRKSMRLIAINPWNVFFFGISIYNIITTNNSCTAISSQIIFVCNFEWIHYLNLRFEFVHELIGIYP